MGYDNGMTESKTETRTCRFPGCSSMAEEGDPGVGRPPEYCVDPTHNRGAAWRVRKAERAALGQPVPDDLGRPVAMAGARAGEYVHQVASQVEQLSKTLGAVVEELRTLGDPDAAAAQIEAVTAEAEQRTAEAAARAARAVQNRHEAEQSRAEADSAAEEAVADVERLTAELGVVSEAYQGLEEASVLARQENAQLVDRLTGERDLAAAAEIEQTTRADQAEQSRDSLAARVEELRAELEAARTEHARIVADQHETHLVALEELRADRERLAIELKTTRTEHDRAAKDLRADRDQVRADLTAAQTEHALAVKEIRTDRDRVRAELDMARSEHAATIKDLRTERAEAVKVDRNLSADRVAAAEAGASDLRGQVEDLRLVVDELRAARDGGSHTPSPRTSNDDK